MNGTAISKSSAWGHLNGRVNDGVAYPSRLHDATKIASASASFSMSHAPGRGGWRLSTLSSVPAGARRTPVPNTRMTTSWACELISFARRMRWTSASDLVRRARCKAVRRYASDDALELLVKNGGSSGNWAVCGSVWTSALGAAARAEAKDKEKDSVWRICVTLCVLRLRYSRRRDGPHQIRWLDIWNEEGDDWV